MSNGQTKSLLLENMVSVKQIAAHLGVSKETIYCRLKDKTIPCYRVGKLWRFKKSEIDEWVLSGGAAQ